MGLFFIQLIIVDQLYRRHGYVYAKLSPFLILITPTPGEVMRESHRLHTDEPELGQSEF